MSICKIEGIIKPFKLEEVKDALVDLDVSGLTVYEVKGFGRQHGHKEIYRGSEYKVDYIPKLKMEILVPAERADEVIEAVAKAARTGAIGDGKLFVVPIESITRIRTSEKDLDAV